MHLTITVYIGSKGMAVVVYALGCVCVCEHQCMFAFVRCNMLNTV